MSDENKYYFANPQVRYSILEDNMVNSDPIEAEMMRLQKIMCEPLTEREKIKDQELENVKLNLLQSCGIICVLSAIATFEFLYISVR